MTDISAMPELRDADRLQIYKYLTDVCSHLYSKNNLQKEKFDAIVPTFVKLAKEEVSHYKMMIEISYIKLLSLIKMNLQLSNLIIFEKRITLQHDK
jgi:hypothetical protein